MCELSIQKHFHEFCTHLFKGGVSCIILKTYLDICTHDILCTSTWYFCCQLLINSWLNDSYIYIFQPNIFNQAFWHFFTQKNTLSSKTFNIKLLSLKSWIRENWSAKKSKILQSWKLIFEKCHCFDPMKINLCEN